MDPHWKALCALAEEELKATLENLPGDLRSLADQIPIAFETRPSPEMQEDGIEADTLGLFVGDPCPEGQEGGGEIPPQILLFLENLWDCADYDEGIFREEVRITLLHEIGHYFGWDEGDVESRGL